MTAAYPMDETRLVFIEKAKRFMTLVWRLAATRQAFTFLATNGLSIGSLSNKRKRGVSSHLRKNFELTDVADDAYLQ